MDEFLRRLEEKGVLISPLSQEKRTFIRQTGALKGQMEGETKVMHLLFLTGSLTICFKKISASWVSLHIFSYKRKGGSALEVRGKRTCWTVYVLGRTPQ